MALTERAGRPRRLLGAMPAGLGLLPPAPPAGTPGDPGLFGPDSAAWMVARERAILVGGQAALLLQIAHPLIAAAVAAHSGFHQDPLQRLRRTLDATLVITFGDSSQAAAAAGRVRASHRPVHGELSNACCDLPAGTRYDASDPELAMWVHATLVASALDAFDTFVAPLTRSDRERYYQDSKSFAALFGVTPAVMPASYRDLEAYFRSSLESTVLCVCEPARRLAEGILHPGLPNLGWAFGLGRVLTAGLLPSRFRREFGLRWTSRERALFASVRAGARVTLPRLPDRSRYWPHYLAAKARLSAAPDER